MRTPYLEYVQKILYHAATKELTKAENKKAAVEAKAAEEAKKGEAEDVLKKLLASGMTAEAIQTILRREAYPHPYEALKALTRTNTHMTEETIHEFIKGLNVSDSVKAELMAITPSNYTGI